MRRVALEEAIGKASDVTPQIGAARSRGVDVERIERCGELKPAT